MPGPLTGVLNMPGMSINPMLFKRLAERYGNLTDCITNESVAVTADKAGYWSHSLLLSPVAPLMAGIPYLFGLPDAI